MTSRRQFVHQFAAISGASFLTPGFLRAEDWPNWRGKDNAGVWNESGILTELPRDQVPIRWTSPIGSGYSGPVVSGGRVFVTDKQTEPEQTERVLCFDEGDGKLLWKHEYPCKYSIGYPAGPRASVSVADGIAYALGAMGHLHAIEASTGKVLWQRDLNVDYKIEMPIWGISASPLVYKDLLLLQIGGSDGACALAIDRVTGKERWHSLKERAQYSAPIIIRQANADVVVFWTGDTVSGLDPSSGKVHWSIPFKPKNMPIGVATPVVEGDRLFLTSFYDGSMMLHVPKESATAEILWHIRGASERQTEALHSIISTPIFRNGYIYGVDSYGELRCLDAKDGKRVWEDKTATPQDRWSTIHFVEHGQQTWMLNELGELLIAKLSPEGFTELSRAKLIEPTLPQLARRGGRGVCWSHPAFADKAIFARSDKELLRADLAAG